MKSQFQIVQEELKDFLNDRLSWAATRRLKEFEWQLRTESGVVFDIRGHYSRGAVRDTIRLEIENVILVLQEEPDPEAWDFMIRCHVNAFFTN